ncbi:MAG TPA: hypothetical protein VFO86_06690, partial [Terriglobia bacterium]|nr:hypothetical protein [Terriglobia bacterium]
DGNAQIFGFSASADAGLTPLPGSPFPTTGKSALNTTGIGSILFGIDSDNIDSFRINPDGCLSLENSTWAAQGVRSNPSLEPVFLYLDPTGTNLYSFDYNPPDGLQSKFASYNFDATTGQVKQIGGDVAGGSGALAIASDDRYAVATYCSVRGGRFIGEYQRGSDGALTFLRNAVYPSGLPGEQWCPGGIAADGSDHVVVEVTPFTFESPPVDPNSLPRLAVYTLDGSGNLTTTSDSGNMIESDFGPANYQFSPDSRYLAASGFAGLQIFAWDSASMTLKSIEIVKTGATCGSGSVCSVTPGFRNFAWDENDHLFLIVGQQLFVYAVSSSGVKPVSGSPYAVQKPQWVTVVPENSQ